MKIADLTGLKYNKWLVIKQVKTKNTQDRLWECKCECGNTGFVKTYHLRKGYSKQCVQCGHLPKKYKEELPNVIWDIIQRRAKRKNFSFEISKDYIYRLFLKQKRKCALSGLKLKFPSYSSELINCECNASLDRIDSKKGYIKGNVQWVHKHINRMKNIFNEDYFIEMCDKISKFKSKVF